MKAIVYHAPKTAGAGELRAEEQDPPLPGPGEILVRVDKCGVCRTDLHVVEGDLPPLHPTIIPGHEIVGSIAQVGAGVTSLSVGDRVGIPWLHHTCGHCEYCLTGRENLCVDKQFTGYSVNGGYAQFAVGDERYVFRLPAGDPAKLAPLLCSGIIGYRSLKLALPRPGGRIGLFGFGSSAHLAIQLASKLGFETVAYTRNPAHADLARKLGANDVVLSSNGPSQPSAPTLDGAVVFAPVGEVVLQALRELKKGGTLSIASIHLSPIPPIDYDRWLFGERKIVSVEANTRADAREFLDLAFRLKLESAVTVRPLVEARDALLELKSGKVVGSIVLDCSAT